MKQRYHLELASNQEIPTPEDNGMQLYLQPHGVLVLPLHVVDVPGNSLHGVYGFLHHLVSLCVLLHVVGYLLHTWTTHRAGSQHLHKLGARMLTRATPHNIGTRVHFCTYTMMQANVRTQDCTH